MPPTPMRVMRFGHTEGATQIKSSGTKWLIYPVVRSTIIRRRTLLPAQTASVSYAMVGSKSNAAENGIDKENGLAAIWGNRPDEREIAHIRLLATDMVAAPPPFAGPVLGRPQLGVDPVEPPWGPSAAEADRFWFNNRPEHIEYCQFLPKAN